MTDLSGVGARVLLIATATHHGPTLPSVPSVARTFEDLRTILLERCGVQPNRLRGVLDPPDAQAMALAVTEEAQRADTVLLVYFIGHGLLSPGGEVYLAAGSTDRLVPGMAEHQALSFSALREAVAASRASSVVVVLDCCFSGRASFGGGASVPAFTMEPAYGMYLIGSAEQLALAPPDAVHTAFTGALIELLTHGDPRSPHLLTLDAVYDAMFRAMRDKQQPLPRRQSGDRSGDLVIAPNLAAPAQPQPLDEPQHPGRCPYPGLAPFEIDDADAFFGREEMTGRLVTAVADKSAPLVLVGPSGSGKSSLLNAGLRARLRADGLPGMPGSAGWPCVRLTPGVSPLRRLAAQLNAVTPDSGDLLREDPAHAVELVDNMLADRPGERLIVLVDQLEELFVLCPDQAERTAFLQAVTAITEAVDDKPPRGLVVLALRADFYGRAAEHPELLTALRDRQLLVEPMTPGELRAAIEQPAAATGLALDDGLADVILHELGATTGGPPQTGALPLLSHALWATWRERAGSRLTVAGYRATGGISQAIATTAEQVYAALDDEGQNAARRILPRLVRVGEDNVDTARPAERSTLLHGLPDTRAAQHAMDRLTEARLLTLDRDTARISHEALLHAWPRLREWLNADRDWLRARQQLTDDAEAWERSKRDPSLLYRGNRLAAVRERAAEAPTAAGDLEPGLAEFMDTSWQHERRGIRRRRGVITTLAILLVAAGIATTIAISNAAEARRQRDLALSRQLAAQAGTLTTSDPVLAQQLAAAAWHIAPTPEARRSMLNALATRASGTLTGPTDRVEQAVFSHDGHTLATLVEDGTVWLWDMRTRLPIGDALDTGFVSRIAFGPDDTTLVTAGDPIDEVNPVQIWNLGSPNPTRERFAAGQNTVELIELSADGSVLAAYGWDGTVRLWDLRTRTPIGGPFQATSDGDSLNAVGLSADGAVLATGGGDGTVRLWDVRTRTPIGSVTGHTEAVDEIVFSPGGTTLATWSRDGTVRLWNAWTHALVGTPLLVGNALAIALSPDGNSVAVADQDNTAQLWDTWSSKPVGGPLAGHTESIYEVALSPDGATLVTASDDGAIRLWDTRSNRSAGAPLLGHTDDVNDIAFTPDGTTLASASADGTARLWDVRSRDPVVPPIRHTGRVDDVAFDHEGRILATVAFSDGDINGDVDGSARLWDARSRTPIDDSIPDSVDVHTIAFSPSGTVLAVASGHTVQIWNAGARTHVGDLFADEQPYRIAFSPDGTTLAANDGDTVRLWDVRSREPIGELTGHTDVVQGVAFSPDGTTLATVSNDRTLRLWDTRSRAPIGDPLTGHTGPVYGVAFHQDGTTLATAGFDNTIRLWDVPSHSAVGDPLTGHSDSVSAVIFSPDGTMLATASADHTVRLWDLGPRIAPLNAICARTTPLTPDVWARYAPGKPLPKPCA